MYGVAGGPHGHSDFINSDHSGRGLSLVLPVSFLSGDAKAVAPAVPRGIAGRFVEIKSRAGSTLWTLPDRRLE